MKNYVKTKNSSFYLWFRSRGGQRSTIDLINATNEKFDNYLILLENIRDYEPEGIDISYVCQNKKIYKKLNRIGDRLLAKKLEKILKEKNIDIVVSHMEVTAKVLRYVDIKKIYYMRTDTIQELEGLKKRSLRRYKKREKLYKKIFTNQNLITVSQETKEKLERFTTFNQIENIYNPFDFDKIRNLALEKLDLPDKDYIVQIGGGFDVKGQDILIKAFAQIENKDIKLALLGTNRYKELDILIDKYNLLNRVIYLGFKTNPYPYIKNAKLLVLSSRREGLPRAVVESLVLGVPVVSTNCETGPKEILTGVLKNYLVDVDDYKNLAKKIDKALEFYPNIENKYIDKFDKNTIRKKYIDFIKKVLNEPTDK